MWVDQLQTMKSTMKISTLTAYKKRMFIRSTIDMESFMLFSQMMQLSHYAALLDESVPMKILSDK